MAIDRSLLEQSGLFGGLPADELDRLVRQMRVVRLNKGRLLFSAGDESNGCYAVMDGGLKVTIVSSEGEETLLAVLGPGDVVGEMGLLDREPRSAGVVALRESRVAYLSTGDFDRIAEENPSIYRYLLKVACARLRSVNESFAVRQMLPLSGRLARSLLRMGDEFGEPLDQGRVLVRQKVTQVDLARMAGVARENVNRQISAWRKEKLISKISQYYCLEDVAALKKLAGL